MLRDKTLRRTLLAVAILAAFAIAQQSAKSAEPASAVREAYLRAYNSHNVDAVLALYADDAVLISDAGSFHGPAEIRNWLKFAIDQGSVLESITADREKSSETLSYGTGHTRRLVGNEVHLGKYLIVMEKRNGQWKIIEHASLNVKE